MMSSSRQLDALAAARKSNARLTIAVVIVAALGALGMYFAHAMPKNVDLHIAPNMNAGDTVHLDNGQSPVPEVNVYGFAYYVWQQVNRWQDDGSTDYGKQIYRFQSYITPRCRAQLQDDMDRRQRANELRSRTRQITEIPGFGYTERRVVADGPSAWTVLLDMQLMETFRGQSIKDTFIRYPIRVVRYDVDRQRNPWRLAVDCYGSHRPARLDQDSVAAVSAGEAEPSLPQRIQSPDLPQPVEIPTHTPQAPVGSGPERGNQESASTQLPEPTSDEKAVTSEEVNP